MVRIIPMASSIRPSLSSSFRLCNNTTTSRPAAASLTSFISPPSRRLPFLSSGLFHLLSFTYLVVLISIAAVRYSELFGLKPSKPCGQESTSFRVGAAGNMAQASTTTQENILDWVKQDNRRMLHVVYRVGDLDRTIKFYTECLGMKLLRKRDIPEERYTNAFLGYGPEDSNFVIEITYNYGVDKYDIGSGFGHFGIAVDDVVKTVELVKAKGGKVTREPGPVKGGSTVIAFIEDPDGYKFELLERGPTPEPLCQVMLRVGDLDRAIKFYEKAFGMELLRKRDNPEYKYTIAMMGYGPEDKNAVLELTYNYGVTEYEKGNAYAQIAIGTDDVYKTAEAVKLFGGKITREPGPLPGINTKITACLDPDGWKTVFVDNIDFLKELE
ncbi:Probable lactoylglutathione lyase, chloroplastic [Linum perenne]